MTTFAGFIGVLMASAAQAALIPVVTRIGGPADGAAFTANEATGGATTNLNQLLSGGNTLWVSYALGLKDDATSTAAGEKIAGIDVNLLSSTADGGFHQRWAFDDGTGTYNGPASPTPTSTNISSGDSHLVVPASAIVGRTVTETRGLKASDDATSTVGYNTANLGFVDGVRNWGIGGSMDGAWALTQADQNAQVAGNTVNFAYIVVPRGYGLPKLTLTAIVQRTDGTGALLGGPITFTGQDFFAVPEPASLSLLFAAVVGMFGYGRRR